MISDQRLRGRLIQQRNGWTGTPTPPEPTTDDIAYARALIADPCSYCGGPAGMLDHIDHAKHGWANLTATCKPCNSAKGQRTLLRSLLAARLNETRRAASEQIRALGRANEMRAWAA